MIELIVDDDVLRISLTEDGKEVYIGFESGESGMFNLKDFTEHVLKFYKEHF